MSHSNPDSIEWKPPLPEKLEAALPQYQITGILGRGGMGVVYRGRQISLNRDVAIKLLPEASSRYGSAMNFSERFLREAQAMAKLSHPSILSVYSYGKTPEGQLYFVMEFVDGMDIFQYLQAHGGRIPSEYAISIAIHVLDALSYAHDSGIVHRDIKPSNVMLDREGRVKIADFGLAKTFGAAADPAAQNLTLSHLAVGTPDFVAPETLDIDKVPDHRVDLYAVGVMLYQMLTGKLPRGNFKLPSELIPEIDSRLDFIVERAMEPDPEERYADAAEMRKDLDDFRCLPPEALDSAAGAAVPKTSGLMIEGRGRSMSTAELFRREVFNGLSARVLASIAVVVILIMVLLLVAAKLPREDEERFVFEEVRPVVRVVPPVDVSPSEEGLGADEPTSETFVGKAASSEMVSDLSANIDIAVSDADGFVALEELHLGSMRDRIEVLSADYLSVLEDRLLQAGRDSDVALMASMEGEVERLESLRERLSFSPGDGLAMVREQFELPELPEEAPSELTLLRNTWNGRSRLVVDETAARWESSLRSLESELVRKRAFDQALAVLAYREDNFGKSDAEEVSPKPELDRAVSTSEGPLWPEVDPHFSREGRFCAWSSIPNDRLIDLEGLKGIDDPKQVLINSSGWFVLRENGDLVGRQGTILKGVVKICRGWGADFGAITDQGELRVFPPRTDPITMVPKDLGPVRDAYVQRLQNFALLEDGSIACWGKDNESGGRWRGRPVVPPGRKAMEMSASDLFLAVRLDDDSFVVWNSQGRLGIPEELAPGRVASFQVNRFSMFVATKPDGRVLSIRNPLFVEGNPVDLKAETYPSASSLRGFFVTDIREVMETTEGRLSVVEEGYGVEGIQEALRWVKKPEKNYFSVAFSTVAPSEYRSRFLWYSGER